MCVVSLTGGGLVLYKRSVQKKNPFLPAHPAYFLHRVCQHPILGYLCRVADPETVLCAARSFDMRLRHTLITKLDLPSDLATEHPSADVQISLPLRHGGLGIRPYFDSDNNGTGVSSAAYVASIISAMPDLLPLIRRYQQQFPIGDDRRRKLPRTPMFDTFRRAYREQLSALALCREHDVGRKRKPREDVLQLPASPHDVVEHFGDRDNVVRKAQRTLSRRLDFVRSLHLQQQQQLADNSSNNDLTRKLRARLLSASQPAAKRWLSQPPRAPDSIMSNTEFGHTVRHLLALPPDDNMPRTCICGASLQEAPFDHFHSCKTARKAAVNSRHNFVNEVIIATARTVGMTVSREPHHPKDPSAPEGSRMRKRAYRPDAALFTSRSRYHIDVMVTHPASNSYVTAASECSLAAANNGEKNKIKKNAEWAAHTHYTFLPFVVESFGAIGKSAMKVVNIIADFAESMRHSTKSACRNRLLTDISIALQRGNALISLDGLTKARRGINPYLDARADAGMD